MSASFDLVIRHGTVVDGSGNPGFEADVGVIGNRIAAVAPRLAAGIEEIDAKGALVTPGFVDMHTHYDGQATWASRLLPSSHHGVTTVLMGNCGVGFAPCRSDDHDRLIELMEGVEDIPEIVLADGLPRAWETFPDYLDFLASRRYDMDVAAQLPHSALRVYVMGQRGADREPATEADERQMSELARQAMLAGALGFSTSRTRFHKTGLGEPIPSLGASESELAAIAEGMRQAGSGAIEIACDFDDVDEEFSMLRNIAASSRRPMTIPIADVAEAPGRWRRLLELIAQSSADGLAMKAQVTARPVGMLMGHALSCNPFSFCPSYRALDGMAADERLTALRDPVLRARLLSEEPGVAPSLALERVRSRLRRFHAMFVLGNPPDYLPPADRTIAALAAQRGVTPEEVAYDAMIAEDAGDFLYLPIANFVDASDDPLAGMLASEHGVIGIGDGGAHYGSICDASYTTFMLTHWARDRKGGRIGVEQAVEALTSRPAAAIGLADRGRIAVGLKADLNVIDFDGLHLHAPEVSYGLPGNGRYLLQRVDGYLATIVSGQVTYRDACPTEALPGRLVRGPQAAPNGR